MLNSYELGINLLKEDKVDLAKDEFIKAYEEGNKRALYYLRQIKNRQGKYNKALKELEYTKEISTLGYEVFIPSNWIKFKSIDDKCFDTITIDKDDKYIYNAKTQVFLIEIPDGCMDLISIDKVISNMCNIDEIREYKNSFCKGKLIKDEGIDGSINYTLMTTGKRGIYEFKVCIDLFLEEDYKDIVDNIFSSFKILD